MIIPEISLDFQSDVRRLLDSARLQIEAGEKHVESPCPSADPPPVPESRTRGFPRMASHWLLPGGVGFFFDDRPFGEGLKFAKWLEHLIYYYDGRFGADVALPFVALNMA